MGNLRSVQKAFEACGAKPRITDRVRDIEKAEKVILPGVGAFTHAMHELKKRRLVEPLKEKIQSGAPYLGLCLGLQLLFSRSEEGERVKGLDIVQGPVKKFRGDLKVPHMGWNTLRIKKKGSPLLNNTAETDYFYFVHSYYPVPADERWGIGWTDYGIRFSAAIARENLVAVQFHPEKSGAPGLKMLANFCRWGGDDAQ